MVRAKKSKKATSIATNNGPARIAMKAGGRNGDSVQKSIAADGVACHGESSRFRRFLCGGVFMRRHVYGIIGTLLLVLLALSAPSFANAQDLTVGPYTKGSSVGSFSFDQYEARVFSTSGSPSQKTIQHMMQCEYPSYLITHHEDTSEGFDNAIAAWRGIHSATDPEKISQYILDEKGYCEAIIFSVFLSAGENEDLGMKIFGEVNSEVGFLSSTMDQWVRAADQIDFATSMKNLSFSDRRQLREDFEAVFKSNHPVLSDFSECASAIDAAFEVCDTVGDSVRLMVNLVQLVELSDGMKTVLQTMADQCSDSVMKAALNECAASMQSAEAAINISMVSTASGQAINVASAAVSDVVLLAVEANPYAAAFMKGARVGDLIGTTICNTCFSTDETIEQYVKMKYLDRFIATLRATTASLQSEYQSSPSEATADAYLAAVESLFSACKLGCDFASNFASILYTDTVLIWSSSGQGTYSVFMNKVASIKSSYEQMWQGLLVNAKCELEADDPALFEELFGGDAGSVHVQGISFAQDEITMDMEYSVLWLPAAVVSPSDATNKKVEYSSSDPSVLEIESGTQSCRLHKEGTVTVFATSHDGGYIASMVVHVADHAQETAAIDSGRCGQNAFWELDENHQLYIYGDGEMYDYSVFGGPWGSEAKHVFIGGGIASIGDGAFYSFDDLESVSIGVGVKEIGNDSFSGCRKLKQVEMPRSIEAIGDRAFDFCDQLSTISIGPCVKRIGQSAFGRCKQLTVRIDSESALESIGPSAFSCCRMELFSFPESLKEIGSYAFEENSFKSITLPANVSTIGEGAFSYCTNMESVTLPNGGNYKTIEADTFRSCVSLKKVAIPASVETIADGTLGREDAFGVWHDIYDHIENPYRYYEGGAFSKCESLEKIEFEAGSKLVHLGSGAFFECLSLSRIELPPSLKAVGEHAISIRYRAPKKMEITIPASVESIGARGIDLPCFTDLTIRCQYGSVAHKYALSLLSSWDPSYKSCFHLVLYDSTGRTVRAIDSANIYGLEDKSYTGKRLRQNLRVEVEGETLVEGVDYVAEYKGNVDVGTATVTVIGRGNFVGSKSVTYTIAKAANKATAAKVTVKKTLKANVLKKKAATVALPKATASFGTAKWKVVNKDKKKVLTLKNGKVKVKKGAKKGAYTIKLKAAVVGTANYSAASTKVVTVKVTVK